MSKQVNEGHSPQFLRSVRLLREEVPILMSYPAAQIYLLGGDTIRPVSYVETEHFMVTRDFLNDHRRALRALMDEDDSSSRSDD